MLLKYQYMYMYVQKCMSVYKCMRLKSELLDTNVVQVFFIQCWLINVKDLTFFCFKGSRIAFTFSVGLQLVHLKLYGCQVFMFLQI